MPEWIAFVAGTAFLAHVSRASLREPNSHGFYRFFAWELMLILVVMNLNGWYSAPPSLDQTICSVLMWLSLFMVVVSYLSLRLFGRQDAARSDTALLEFEKTTVLVSHGIYRLIRHPMYDSLLLLNWGLFFKNISWLSGSLALMASFLLVIAALTEESENVRFFGAQYREYMQRTKRFVPFLL